jgi:hypothetical protein
VRSPPHLRDLCARDTSTEQCTNSPNISNIGVFEAYITGAHDPVCVRTPTAWNDCKSARWRQIAKNDPNTTPNYTQHQFNPARSCTHTTTGLCQEGTPQLGFLEPPQRRTQKTSPKMSSLICFHAKISRGPLAGVGGGPLKDRIGGGGGGGDCKTILEI